MRERVIGRSGAPLVFILVIAGCAAVAAVMGAIVVVSGAIEDDWSDAGKIIAGATIVFGPVLGAALIAFKRRRIRRTAIDRSAANARGERRVAYIAQHPVRAALIAAPIVVPLLVDAFVHGWWSGFLVGLLVAVVWHRVRARCLAGRHHGDVDGLMIALAPLVTLVALIETDVSDVSFAYLLVAGGRRIGYAVARRRRVGPVASPT